ncbi:MAG: hypothetical protein H6700_09880 [Myxococcales bacterium]|nr:hypothetical protein [Myxococcales bacterium]MCB9532063.1 hypothetical protein [Myxococcales bacterium]
MRTHLRRALHGVPPVVLMVCGAGCEPGPDGSILTQPSIDAGCVWPADRGVPGVRSVELWLTQRPGVLGFVHSPDGNRESGRLLTDAETQEWSDLLSGDHTAEFQAQTCTRRSSEQRYWIRVDRGLAMAGVRLEPMEYVCIPSTTESVAAQALITRVDRLCMSIVERAFVQSGGGPAAADADEVRDAAGL